MEVFKVFATMSLVDMISGPLGRISAAMKAAGGAVSGLSGRMGQLAIAMAPVALAAGVLLGALLSTTSAAMAFESAMADVAKVVDFDTPEEFKAMNQTVMDMAGRLPMAADGIAAIISAAGQSGVAKQDLAGFAEQAAKMGIAFDLTGDQAGKMMADWRAGMNLSLPRVYALADAVNHLSNNMNATAPALGELLQRTGPLAMQCGLAETQVAALGTAFLSAGASPEIASTALKKFVGVLARGEGLSKRGADAFQSLGFSVTQMAKDMQTDAQGTIFKVLQAIADKPKELQMAMLTDMFGEEAIGAIAPLLSNMGNLTKAFDLVGDASAYAGSMQKEFEARSATTENALQLMRNRLTNLSISIGNAFLPAIGWSADKLGLLAAAARWVTDSTLGQWLLKIIAALSLAAIGVTVFSIGAFMLPKALALIGKALAPLKTAFVAFKGVLLAISWPVWLVIGAFAALYLAYTTNFGGIADSINGFFNKVSLVFKGVKAVITSLQDGVGEIRGELATEIDAGGLVGVVTFISKAIYRIIQIGSGIADGFRAGLGKMTGLFEKAFGTLGKALAPLGEAISGILAKCSGPEVTSASSEWVRFGQVLVGLVALALEAVGTAVLLVANTISNVINAVRLVIALFTGDFAGAAAIFQGMLATMGDSILALADLLGIGDWMREAWQDAMDFLSGINLFESGSKIIDTLMEGIKNKAAALVDSVKGVFSNIRDLLPFSDAKTGPLSELTASGGAIMTTLGQGVTGNADALSRSVTGALEGAGQNIGTWRDGLSGMSLPGLAVPGEAILPAVAGGLPRALRAGPLPQGALPPPVASIPQAAPTFDIPGALASALGDIGQGISGFFQGLFTAAPPAMPAPAIPPAPEFATDADPKHGDRRGGKEGGGRSLVVHIGQLILPNATNGQSFLDDLEAFVSELGGDVSEA